MLKENILNKTNKLINQFELFKQTFTAIMLV